MTDYAKPPVSPAFSEAGDNSDPPTLAEIQGGWPKSATPATRQRWNWLMNWMSNGIRYQMQTGIPEWDTAEAYRAGSFVQYGGKLWLGQRANTGIQPGTSDLDWKEFSTGGAVWTGPAAPGDPTRYALWFNTAATPQSLYFYLNDGSPGTPKWVNVNDNAALDAAVVDLDTRVDDLETKTSVGVRFLVEGAATSGQTDILLPQAITDDFTDVYVGGAALSKGDFTTSGTTTLSLKKGMATGTQYKVVGQPRFNGTIQSVARAPYDGVAVATQASIVVPGGFLPGMVDVFVNGAALSPGDFDDTDGVQVKLTRPMQPGMQWRVVSFSPQMAVQPVSGQLAGFRNRITNGDMRVTQRSPAVAFPTNNYGYGGPDRFQCYNGATGGIVAQATSSIQLTNGPTVPGIQQYIDGVPTDLNAGLIAGIMQIVEGADSYDLKGQPVTASFLFLASVAGTYSVALRDGIGSWSYVTTFNYANALSLQRVVAVVPTLPNGMTLPATTANGLQLNIGALNFGQWGTSTLNAWQSANKLCAAGSVNWAATKNNMIMATRIQLEAGGVATQFEQRPIAWELDQCQRYYQRISGSQNGGQPLGFGMAYTPTQLNAYIKLARSMRASPSTTHSQVGAIAPSGAVVTANVAQLYSATPDAVVVNYTMASAAWSVGQGSTMVVGTAVSAGFVEFNAELI